MFAASIAGLSNALALLDRGAVRVNKDEVLEGSLDMQEGVRQARENMAAIRTENKMIGTLLDIFA